MLAKRRIDKLIGLKTNEINSIGTKRKDKATEVPGGNKIEKKFENKTK